VWHVIKWGNMYYTASSVIAAIKANKNCKCEKMENIECLRHVWNFQPEIDDLNNDYHQYYRVFYGGRVTTLCFTYPISSADHRGFIRKKDSSLLQLISRNLIDESLLTQI